MGVILNGLPRLLPEVMQRGQHGLVGPIPPERDRHPQGSDRQERGVDGLEDRGPSRREKERLGGSDELDQDRFVRQGGGKVVQGQEEAVEARQGSQVEDPDGLPADLPPVGAPVQVHGVERPQVGRGLIPSGLLVGPRQAAAGRGGVVPVLQ